jgi:hypothetical protein
MLKVNLSESRRREIDDNIDKKSKDEKEAEKLAKRKKIDLKRKETEQIRLEKKLANIEKQKNGGRGPKVVEEKKEIIPPVKKEKLANKFQKNKTKKVGENSTDGDEEKKKNKKMKTSNDDDSNEKSPSGKKGKGKGKDKKGDKKGEEKPAPPSWGGFKRIRAQRKGK